MSNQNKKHWTVKVLIVIAAITLMVLAVQLLWNWLIPEIFNGPQISYLQAFGLLALTRLLTGFGKGGRHWQGRRGHRTLSPTEKERLKMKFMEKCGWDGDITRPSEEPSEEKER